MPDIIKVKLLTGELWFTTQKDRIPRSLISTLVKQHEEKLLHQPIGEPAIVDIDREPPPQVDAE